MTTVTLHVYDVGTEPALAEVNKLLLAVGTGAFHGGVEVYSKEWSYGAGDSGTGVFCCPPKGCTMHQFRESVTIGQTSMDPQDVGRVLEKLMAEWQGPDYNLLRRNCVLFSDAFCQALGAGSIPSWVKNLAGAGASVQDGAKAATSQAQAAAIIAAAKAGEIDQKYQVKAQAADALSNAQTQAAILHAKGTAKYKELDKQYDFQGTAASAATKTQAQATLLAMQASAKASELDAQYKLQDNALKSANQAWSKILEVDQQYKVKDQASALFTQGLGFAGAALNKGKEAAEKAQADYAATNAQGSKPKDGPAVEGSEANKDAECTACAIL